MKVFVWKEVKTMSGYVHQNGGVVVFAETEERARELANSNNECSIRPDEIPDDVRDVIGGEEAVYYMENVGCCY